MGMESDEEEDADYWRKRALESESRYKNVAPNGVSTASTASTGSSSVPVLLGKLTVAHERALKYHIFNDAWADVKFIPNIHVFKINPELADQARIAMGIKKHAHGDLYDASLMARYKYEINQKRSNVKTAVRKKYRGKCERWGVTSIGKSVTNHSLLLFGILYATGVWLDCCGKAADTCGQDEEPISDGTVRGPGSGIIVYNCKVANEQLPHIFVYADPGISEGQVRGQK